jgi:hypothetical protein
MSKVLIPCQCCGRPRPKNFEWYVCNECSYRVCLYCQGKHKGLHSTGGFKCSQCAFGTLSMQRL